MSIFDSLSESIPPYFRNQTFYVVAKKYKAELAKLIMDFFQKKKIIVAVGSRYSDLEDLDFATLKTIPKEKKPIEQLKNNVQIEVKPKFFSAQAGTYDAAIKLPNLIISGDKITEIMIKTNENFFEEGHDLEFVITHQDERKKFGMKINLMRNVDAVLADIWKIILDKQSTFDQAEEIKNKEHPILPKSDIERIFEYTLGKEVVTKKNSTSIQNVSYDGRIYFSLSYPMEFNPKHSLKGQQNPVFKVFMNLKYTKPDGKGFLARHPEIVEAYQSYLNLMPPGSRKENIEKILPRKTYEEEEKKGLDKLKEFCRRILKYGYLVTNFNEAYSKDSRDFFTFTYFPEVKEKAEKNKAYGELTKSIESIIDDKIAYAATYAGILGERIQDKLADEFFFWYVKNLSLPTEKEQNYFQKFTLESEEITKREVIRKLLDWVA
jgi:hypothetical protein